jgi:hypothetical protein
MRMRSIYLWILTIVLAGFVYIWQRISGPTYPERVRTHIGGKDLNFRLPRSSDSAGDAEIELSVPDKAMAGIIEFQRFRSGDPWTRTALVRKEGKEDILVAYLPHQPMAGKVAYKIYLNAGSETVALKAEPIVLRFRGAIPFYIFWPHLVLIFLAMAFSTRAGIEALLKRPNTARFAFWTVVTMALGGLVCGAIMQKLAFGAYWTGWPLGQDLTDNKTLASFLIWVIALWRIRKKPNATGWVVFASVALFAVFMIPHSLLGSELDYTAPAAK